MSVKWMWRRLLSSYPSTAAVVLRRPPSSSHLPSQSFTVTFCASSRSVHSLPTPVNRHSSSRVPTSASSFHAHPRPSSVLLPNPSSFSTAMSASPVKATDKEEPPASLSSNSYDVRYTSALLLNFPFTPIPISGDVSTSSSSSSSLPSSTSDLSLAVVDAAVSAVRQRLFIHLTADDWSTVTIAQMQHRLAAIYQQAAHTDPHIDTTVILPSSLSSLPTSASAFSSLPLTYLADSHTQQGRTLQHTVTIPPSTSVLLSCDFTSVAQSTAIVRVNPSKSQKKREEAKAAAAEAPKKKRRSTAEIQAEKNSVASRLSQLLSHVDCIGGIHIPGMLGVGSEVSPFAVRSALYPPLSVLLMKDEERESFELGPVYTVDWTRPSVESLSGVGVSTFGSPSTAVVGDDTSQSPFASFKSVVIGGTFDHFHIGHKLLLSTAAFLSSSSLLIGVTAPSMLHKKTLEQLIEPSIKRQHSVRAFLSTIRPELSLEVVEINTAEGPTLERAELDCIVASEETLKGAESINSKRQKQSPPLPPMRIVQLPIFALPPSQQPPPPPHPPPQPRSCPSISSAPPPPASPYCPSSSADPTPTLGAPCLLLPPLMLRRRPDRRHRLWEVVHLRASRSPRCSRDRLRPRWALMLQAGGARLPRHHRLLRCVGGGGGWVDRPEGVGPSRVR